jgi:hypothetical protein
MFISILINKAAACMWKWEQTGNTDKALYDAAERHVAEYCDGCSGAIRPIVDLLLDTIQVTVRICNGFPPNTGVFPPDPDTAVRRRRRS